ncbi:hypothetical protein CcCBS67573_g03534 [Chytriomyces confervae]|uniref:ABC transmembrane type-1 domain-containing protein n=1 Tax=Chytriomyces confervae TaxID=246404 RepID=A0A507FG22_9FUNG|nr:hypothetical protein CcCBS67573_g03534 [Chytriomyces confervae]
MTAIIRKRAKQDLQGSDLPKLRSSVDLAANTPDWTLHVLRTNPMSPPDGQKCYHARLHAGSYMALVLWAIPIQIIVAFSILASMLGNSVGAGLGALLASLSLLSVAIPTLIIKSIPHMNQTSDFRVKLIRDVLDGIKLLKIRSLENEFMDEIRNARGRQIIWLERFIYGVVSFVVIGQLATYLMPTASFSQYAARGNSMSPAVVFPALTLFNMLISPLILFPQVLNAVFSASISWNRVFPVSHCSLIENNVGLEPPNLRYCPSSCPAKKQQLDRKKRAFTLRGIDLAIPRGQFVVIVGRVGSGEINAFECDFGPIGNSERKGSNAAADCHSSVANHIMSTEPLPSILATEESETGNVKSICGDAPSNKRAFVLSSMWLTWWTSNSLLNEPRDVGFWTLWYNVLAWVCLGFLVCLNLIIRYGIVKSTKSLHEKGVEGVLNSPMWWFESQQIGRIMNRFTKDMNAIDRLLFPNVFQVIAGVGALLSMVVILAITSPYLLIGVIPLTVLYLYVLGLYRSTKRQLRRLESTQRSPLFSHIAESLEGVTTIAAYNKQAYFGVITTNLFGSQQ